MNKARNLVEMGEFYASTILTEAKKNFPPKDTFAVAGKKTSDAVIPANLKKPKAFDERGPLAHKNGEALVKPLEAKDAKGKKTFTGVEKLSLAPEKMEVETINTFMNKSIFDRLFEDVMSDNITSPEAADQHDAEALDLPGTEERGSEEVTITLSKELAGKLHDALMAVLGSDEEQHGEEEGAGEEEDAEEHVAGCKCDKCVGSEDDESTLPEATELKELPSTVEKMTKVGGNTNQVSDSWSTHHVDGTEGAGEVKVQAQPSPKKEKLAGPTPVKGTANYVASMQSGERTKKNHGKVAFTK